MKLGFFFLLLTLVLAAPVLVAGNVTFTSPAGGEVWARGSQHTITYTLADEAPQYEVVLKQNGAFVGYIFTTNYGNPAGVVNHQWEVGKVQTEEGDSIWAPIGGGYTICVGCGGSGPPPYGVSNTFTIGPVKTKGNVTYTSPAGGEYWFKGTTHALIYSFSQALGYHIVTLKRDGARLGIIRHASFPANAGEVINYPWQVGEVTDDDGNPVSVPSGRGYCIAAGLMSGMVDSKRFTIGPDVSALVKFERIYYVPLSIPGGCPQCFILDLNVLREELVKLNEPVEVGLYRQGKTVADLGKIGRGRKMADKLQVKLEPEALAAMNRGEKFELRLFIGSDRLVHSQSLRLVATVLKDHKLETIQKR